MVRAGLLSRLLLILLSSFLALAAASLFLLRWQDVHGRRRAPAPFLRVEQTAAIADAMAASPRAAWSRIADAVGAASLRVQVADRAPPVGALIAAPRLEAKLHGFGSSSVSAAMRVYTSRHEERRSPRDGVEGFMARAVGPLPDGRVLVVDAVIGPDRGSGLPLGLPYGVWMGLFGAMVAALAVYGTARETRPVHALARALDRFDGVAPMIVAEPRRASDLQSLTLAVNAMQRRVASLVGERMLMIGAISHDLRTLLTRLQLRIVALPETERARLAADLETMRDILDDVLAFSRGVDIGLARSPMDLSDLVASEVAENEAVGVRLPIGTRLADAPVVGDSTALRRVVANLLDNALKFGRTRVIVEVRREGDTIRLSVADDGPGVPAAERRSVLLPFHRLEAVRNPEHGGVGLGLAIAHQIVVAHGGALRVETADLGGADIQVTLPRA